MAEFLDNFEDLLEDPTETGNESEETLSTIQNTEEVEENEENNEEELEEENEEENQLPDYSDNPLYSFLQQRGVSDPSKLSMTNEDGSVEEVDFNSLSAEEQIEILKEVTDPGLNQSEIEAINYMRQNGNATLEQIVNYFAQKKLEEYLNEHPEDIHNKVYEIDDYTDDDLFLIDLKRRYPDFSDEDLISKLEKEKEDEDLFKKETDALRKAFKEQEDQAEAEREQLEKQQIEDLRTNLMNAAGNFNEIQLDYTDDKSDSLVIEDEDKQQMLSYILDQDAEGKSALVHDLENPDALIELAWLRTKGADVLSDLTKYWKKLLADERSTNKKLQAQLDKLSKKETSSVVVPQDPTNKKKPNGESIWDNSGLI